jgi:hypothetical protein
MKFLIGTWNCTESNTRRAKPYSSSFTTSMDPSGYWMITKTRNDATSFSPASTAEDQVTYDAGTSRWVDINTDSTGFYGATFSSGWRGNQIAWRPSSFNASVNSGNVVSGGVTTITKVSAAKYTYVSSFKERSGRTVAVTGRCSKT